MPLRPLLFLFAAGAACLASAEWTATVLHPTGVDESYGLAGGGGMQVGYVYINNVPGAAMWLSSKASYVSLVPTGAERSVAYDTDGSNQVGYATFAGMAFAGMWSGTAASWVNLNPAGSVLSEANGVDNGLQVGCYKITDTHACIWSGSAASMLDVHPAGASTSRLWGIGDGKQVGEANIGGKGHAGVWSGTAASFVDLHPAGADFSIAYASAGGKQGGFAVYNGDQNAALWSGTASSFVNLHPAGASFSVVRGILGSYQVGYVRIAGATRPVIWTGSANSYVDLLPTLPATYTGGTCKAIWTDGTTLFILGEAYDTIDDVNHAILWKRGVQEAFVFSLNKTQVAGQNSVQGTISLAAVEGSPAVFSIYDNSSLVTTPPSVTVPAGSILKNFQITVTAVTAPINTTVFAKRGAVIQSRPLTLVPLVPTALAFTPSQVTGGSSLSCRVVINGVAGPGGRTIAILDNSANATVPSTVVVPPGATDVTFTITTTAVTSQKTVTVTARVTAGEKTGTFKINP